MFVYKKIYITMFQMLDSSNKNIQFHIKIPQSVEPSP